MGLVSQFEILSLYSTGGIIAKESHHSTTSHSSSHTTKKSSVTNKWRLSGRKACTIFKSHSDLNTIINAKGLLPLEELEKALDHFDDLERIRPTTEMKDVEVTLVKYCSVMSSAVGKTLQTRVL